MCVIFPYYGIRKLAIVKDISDLLQKASKDVLSTELLSLVILLICTVAVEVG
jgi:hypothetical protein